MGEPADGEVAEGTKPVLAGAGITNPDGVRKKGRPVGGGLLIPILLPRAA
jgi:hypothetical protein